MAEEQSQRKMASEDHQLLGLEQGRLGLEEDRQLLGLERLEEGQMGKEQPGLGQLGLGRMGKGHQREANRASWEVMMPFF